jgi:hypothetical protein
MSGSRIRARTPFRIQSRRSGGDGAAAARSSDSDNTMKSILVAVAAAAVLVTLVHPVSCDQNLRWSPIAPVMNGAAPPNEVYAPPSGTASVNEVRGVTAIASVGSSSV